MAYENSTASVWDGQHRWRTYWLRGLVNLIVCLISSTLRVLMDLTLFDRTWPLVFDNFANLKNKSTLKSGEAWESKCSGTQKNLNWKNWSKRRLSSNRKERNHPIIPKWQCWTSFVYKHICINLHTFSGCVFLVMYTYIYIYLYIHDFCAYTNLYKWF